MPTVQPQLLAEHPSLSHQSTGRTGDETGVIRAHALPVEDVLKYFSTDDSRGLDPASVVRARARYGFNELAEAPAPRWWTRLAGQFNHVACTPDFATHVANVRRRLSLLPKA